MKETSQHIKTLLRLARNLRVSYDDGELDISLTLFPTETSAVETHNGDTLRTDGVARGSSLQGWSSPWGGESPNRDDPDHVLVGDTITTVEQLDHLPGGAIILNKDGDPWKKRQDGRLIGALLGNKTARELLISYPPLTLIHLPEVEA